MQNNFKEYILDTASLYPDMLFLISCCRSNPREEDINLIHTHIVDHKSPTTLIDLSFKHGVLPLVYKTLQNISVDYKHQHQNNHFDTFLHAFQTQYIHIAQRNMLMSAELLSIMKLLKVNDIEALAFKGPTLSQMAYGDITLRQYGDLDILIKEVDHPKMMDLMLKENYIPEIDLKEEDKETFFNCVTVIGLHKEVKNIRVEIHWKLLSKNYAIEWEEESLWQNKKSTKINHKEVPVLCSEQQLLYLCTHGAKHLFERLEWVCDIDRTIRSNSDINWIYLLSEAEKLGIKRMLLLGLALSQEFFKSELPKTIQQKIKEDRAVPKLLSKIIEISFSETLQEGKNHSYFGLVWKMREHLSDRIRFAWHGLFAPQFDDFIFIKLPRHLIFLYPLIRPYRLAVKYFTIR